MFLFRSVFFRTLYQIAFPLLSFNSFSQLNSTITLWKDSAIGAIFNKTTSSVAYGKKDKKGYYKIWISDTLGNNEHRLSFPEWKEDRHQWAEEWYPSGEYLFCYIEKSEYAKEKGHKRKPDDAIPGYGGYTDLWLVKRDGSKAWKLVDLPNNYNSAIIHSAISSDGTLFAWTERIKPPKLTNLALAAGTYVFRVADIVMDSIPHFANIHTYVPGDIPASCELEGISNDKTTVSFYSTFETKNLFTTPIYTMDLRTGKTTRLTTESFSQAPTYTPDGKHFVYMTGAECKIFPFEIQGADWWVMNVDGTHKQRISFMNVKDHPQSVNHYRLAGSISFISNNSFFGGVMSKPLGLTGYTVKVSFKEMK